jgi:hypothetical protein
MATSTLVRGFVGSAMMVSCLVCDAMTITVSPRDWMDVATEAPTFVYLSGPIEADTPVQLKKVLDGIKKSSIMVYLDSPGGNLIAGMEIGRILRAREVSTRVAAQGEKFKPRPGICMSACTYAFIGGAYRYMAEGSKFGVHRAFMSGEHRPSTADLDIGQILSAAAGAYYREMGVDSKLLDLTMNAGKDGIYVLSKSELTSLRVVNNGRKAPEWTIEAVDGGTYLRGVQETETGVGKAVFACNSGRIDFVSFYTAGDKAASIARGQWVHSFMFDKDLVPLPAPQWTKVDGDYVVSSFSAVPTQIVQKMLLADSVGHAMQVGRDAPTFVGYTVDIDLRDRNRVRAYIRNCVRGR